MRWYWERRSMRAVAVRNVVAVQHVILARNFEIRNFVEVQHSAEVQRSVAVQNSVAVGNAVALWNTVDLNLWVPAAWVKPSTVANHNKRVCPFKLKVTGANPESHFSKASCARIFCAPGAWFPSRE
jgi:hypothetical protein